MLKYQKAKVKLLEYEIPEEQWPRFPLHYRDLAFPTVLILSKYAEAINDNLDRMVLQRDLKYCSDFYDAAFQSREQQIHDVDFAISAATAYFFMDDFGSAKVLWKTIHQGESINNEYQRSLYGLFSLTFTGRLPKDHDSMLVQAVYSFWKNTDKEILEEFIARYRDQIYNTESPQSWFWGEIACAIAKLVCESSACLLLPLYSGLNNESWSPYFKRKTAINLLWPSQGLVCKSGILQGKNALLQLPTGVGKTKSIELIIWSMFLSKRGSKALIVVPLRSLCNELSYDAKAAFPREVSINQFSDVLEDDFFDVLQEQSEKQILVCTPEKLQYILHHDCSFLEAIDLYIFDESHMFDDPSRGALYELLLTNIKLRLQERQQLILMSAVLPNAKQIKEWLFGESGTLAYDKKIRSTPKSVGFVDRSSKVHYYTTGKSDEEFFVPYTYKSQNLKLLGKERKAKTFPDDARDIALYYANILCKKGGVAIYFNQRRSILKLFRRIIDLDNRGYQLTHLQELAKKEEILKFQTLFEAYYGRDYIYTQVAHYGILPHYSTLPNGVRVSVEFALKQGYIKAIACTSTLAQGVNTPIKYLLITGTNFSSAKMTARNFQNLIGRTGRSGVYTEGEIIITSTTLYDERYKKTGRYHWKDTWSLIDSSAVEACGSAILNLTKDFEITYSIKIEGAKIIHFICQNINTQWHILLNELILRKLRESDQAARVVTHKEKLLSEQIQNYKTTVDQIENELIFIFSQRSMKAGTSDQLKTIAESLLENSLAYYLGSEEERELLKNLFDSIAEKIGSQIQNIPRYSKSMVSMTDAKKIRDWIVENSIEIKDQSKIDLLGLIEKLFNENYPSSKYQKGMALSWIQGESYEQISKKFNLKIFEIEKLCNYTVSYQMCFLVGNIIDLCDEEGRNLDRLLLLQQNLKYGVDTKTEISVCEKIFNDRFLAHKIAGILGQDDVSEGDIVQTIKKYDDKILRMLQNYPSYFSSVIENL